MTGREALRRVLLWGIVAVFFATTVVLAAFGTWTGVLGFCAFPVVGAIILTSRPRNGVGWYLMLVGVVCLAIMWGLDAELTGLAPAWAESLMTATAGIFWTSLIIIGAIYPTGRIETKLGRVGFWGVAALAAATFVLTLVNDAPLDATGRPNPFGMPGLSVFDFFQDVVYFAAFPVVAGVIVVDIVRRWRRASPVESLQYRWFVFGLGTVIAAVMFAGIMSIAPISPEAFYAVGIAATLTLNLIPISIGIAVTRHGLYEINRIVSRTVAYGTVTALAIGVYALVVTSITWLAPELPSVGVAVATLAAAAVFLPALRWAQRNIDRRFDRERYDAQHVVDAFGERLRSQVDPAATTTDLIVAVERTLQPTSVGIWAGVRR